MIFASPIMCSCNPSIKAIILSMWEIDDPGWDWVLEGWGSRVWGGNVVGSVKTLRAAELFPMGEAREEVLDPFFEGLEGLFFAFLEVWTLLLWRECKEIGPCRGKTIPFLGGWMPLRVKIFIISLQKRKTCPYSWLSCSPTQNLKNVSTNVNLNSINKITEELGSSKTGETCVG